MSVAPPDEFDFHQVLDAVGDGIVVVGRDGNIRYVNRALEQMLGWRGEELLGRPLTVLMPERMHRAHLAGFARYLSTSERKIMGGRPVRVPALRKNGTEFTIELSLAETGNGETSAAVVASLRDLTDLVREQDAHAQAIVARKAAEGLAQQLRESEEQFRILAESIPQLAWVARPDGDVEWYNQRWFEFTGTNAEQMTGWGWKAVHDPALLDEVVLRWQAALVTGEPFEMEFPLRRADGDFIWFLCRVVPFRDGQGTLVRWFGTNTNIHDLKAARAMAERKATSLARIQSVTEALSECLTPEQVAAVITRESQRAFGADSCVLYLLSPDATELTLVGDARGVDPQIIERIRRVDTTQDSVPARALREKRLIVAEAAEEYAAVAPAIAAMQVEGPRAQAFWCAPLFAGERPIGALAMGFHQRRQFASEERDLIDTIARQCAQALDRASAYSRLSDSQRRFQAIFDHSLDAMFIADDEQRILDINPSAVLLLGGRRDELLRAHVSDIIAGPDKAEATRLWGEFLVAGAQRGELRLSRRDGLTVQVGYSATANFVAGQHLSVLRDISAQKHAETRLRFLADASVILGSSLDYQSTLANVTRLAVPMVADWAAVDVLDADGTIRRLAVAHVDPSKVALAHEIWRRWPAKPGDAGGAAEVIRTGKPESHPLITDEILVAIIPDPELLEIIRALGLRSSMCVPLKVQGRTMGAITFVSAESGRRFGPSDLTLAEDLAGRAGVAVDNAELYQSEQNARKTADAANRAKDEFLATVSHELRTPLNAMLGWTRLLRAGELEPERQPRALETIERNAVTQAQLIEDLLDVSRIVSGKLRLDVQSVELAHIVDQAVESLRLASEAKQISILSALDSLAGQVMGDPHRLQQVVWNLVSNAIKFTPKEGRIDLTLERVDSSLRLSVTDSGQGIAAEFLPHVFERFKQADGTTTRSYGGLGLGLAISRHIVELHGGTIQVHSEGLGLGSRFEVNLPVSAVRGDIRRPSARPPSTVGSTDFGSHPELRGLKVLVVDDQEDGRDMVVLILEGHGAIVQAAGSVGEALTMIQCEAPDVLLSDIGMPGEDGYDLIRQVRALPRGSGGDIPAAALTAYARSEDRRKTFDAGYMMHAAKPVEPSELVAMVANLTRFGRPR